jgi:inner membrane protein
MTRFSVARPIASTDGRANARSNAFYAIICSKVLLIQFYMETTEQHRYGIFNSVGFKLTLIVMLTLGLMIPSFMIMELIRDREQRRDETIQEVTSLWGNEQTICGPVLTIPYSSTEKTGQDKYETIIKYAHFLPEKLKIEGVVEPETRYRGIYKVVTYRARLRISGNFPRLDLEKLQSMSDPSGLNSPWIEIGIPDMRGINQDISLHWGDSLHTVIPGIPSHDISLAGVHSLVTADMDQPVNFSFDLDLNGSHSLNFIPVGKETNIRLTSSWSTPSFNGSFLPDERKITSSGFHAYWNVLQLNRNYPQQWTGNQYSLAESSFGVDLITPVDTYQKSMRSVKYAILFIGLTFLIFFFSEVMTKIRVHPINYLLVGMALCIFYSLLTALSEHISFTAAYIAAAVIIITMIGIFARSVFKQRKVSITVVASLVALYTFLFVILQLMDYSLLVGNAGILIVLGIVMYFSRKVDWYSPLKA